MMSSKVYIQNKLNSLAADANVKILLAIESGSRAWGFPSADSDYDVRFVYIRKLDDYLSVFEPRDVIETPLVQDDFLAAPMDLNGWDLRKAMRLGLKSNAVLIEWLVSPVRYLADDGILPQFHEFVLENADVAALLYHYDRLARHAWQEIEDSPDAVKIKRYFYALRPALACVWLRQYRRAPPMNILELVQGLDLPKVFQSQLCHLIEMKRQVMEVSIVERNSIFDDVIRASLDIETHRPESKEPSSQSLIMADTLFRKWIEPSA